MTNRDRFDIRAESQHLDKPVIKQSVGGGFHYVYGYTRWRVLDTATGLYASDLYNTQDDAAAAIQTWIATAS